MHTRPLLCLRVEKMAYAWLPPDPTPPPPCPSRTFLACICSPSFGSSAGMHSGNRECFGRDLVFCTPLCAVSMWVADGCWGCDGFPTISGFGGRAMSPANLEPISPSPPKPHHLLPPPAFPVPHEVPAGPLDAGTVAWSLACSRSRLV